MKTWTYSASKDFRPYQWKAVKFALATPRKAMLLDMGLGKTTITLHEIKALKRQGKLEDKPVLIVGPIRVIYNVWRQEALKWEHTASLRFSIMHGSERKRLAAFNADVDIILTNRENLIWLKDLLHTNGYGVAKRDYDKSKLAEENQRRLRWSVGADAIRLENLPKLTAVPIDYEMLDGTMVKLWRTDGNITEGSKTIAELEDGTPIQINDNYGGFKWVPTQDRKTGDDKDLELLKPPRRDWPFSMLVVDESSMFKNSGTKSWNVLRDFAPMFERVSLLTGTPTPNTMLELWPQVYFLDQGQRLGKTKIAFRDRYFVRADYMGYTYKLRQRVWCDGEVVSGEEAINRAVRDIAMRLDAKDWLDVPEKLKNVVDVELPEDVLASYKDFEEKMFIELTTSTVEAISAASLSQRCHQIANGALYVMNEKTMKREWELIHDAKLEALEEILEETGDNVIVAYQYKHDLERLKTKWPKAPVLGGGGNAAQDELIINDWNAGKTRLLFAHPASAGHGLNLQTGGHTLVFFSLTWSLEQHDQLIARLHRQGQKERVMVHYLRAKETVDELIYAVLQSKSRSQQELLDALREYSLQRERERVNPKPPQEVLPV